MKNLQVRIADDPYEILKELAEERNSSVSDIVRNALEIYALGSAYARQGKRLFWEDTISKEKVELLIPGFTANALLSSRRSS
jgi:hypothetical protein